MIVGGALNSELQSTVQSDHAERSASIVVLYSADTARTPGADLIVLTTHDYTGLGHVWPGSTAGRVVRHALCPVLTVREKNRKTL